jgi:hypothetical protein
MKVLSIFLKFICELRSSVVSLHMMKEFLAATVDVNFLKITMYTNFTTFYPSIELEGWIFCRVSIAPEEKSAVSGFGAFSGVELVA